MENSSYTCHIIQRFEGKRGHRRGSHCADIALARFIAMNIRATIKLQKYL